MSPSLLRPFVCGLVACLGACSEAEPGAGAAPGPLPVFGPAPLTPGASGSAPEGPSQLAKPPGSGGSSAEPLEPGVAGAAGGSAEDQTGEIDGLAPGEGSETDGAGEPGEPAPTDPGDSNGEGTADGPTPSAGCNSAAAPPQGQLTISVGGQNAQYAVTLPPGYQPGVPVPLVFGFHGRNRTHLEFQNVDASQIGTEMGSRAIMAYLKSQAGPGWNFDEEVEPNVAFFEALYPVMLSSYCVDTSRVFAVGHSSGGYFSNILACRFGDRLRGIASIAGATQERTCTGRVAALIIHGVRDSVVNFTGGQGSRDFYLATNQCSGMTQPSAVSPCVDYQGCAAGLPVSWCQHDEPTYENTNHGWPSFASRAAGQFLFALPRR